MSAYIKNALTELNDALIRLEETIQYKERIIAEQEHELYETKVALNDNQKDSSALKMSDDEFDNLSERLDNIINHVEGMIEK